MLTMFHSGPQYRRLATGLAVLLLASPCGRVEGQTSSRGNLPAVGTPAAAGGMPAAAGGGVSGFRRTPPLKPAPRPVGDPRLAGFDSATRLLIETELRSATPTEREHWLSLLATVQPDQVPYLLSARRQANATPPPSSQTPPAAATHNFYRVAATQPAQSPPSGSTPGGDAQPPLTSQPAAEPPSESTGSSTLSPETAAPVEAEPTAPTPRRWMAPLRGRWSEARHESAEPAADTPPPQAAAAEVTPTRLPAATPRSSAYMNVELQRVMTLLRTELEEAQKSGTSLDDPRHRRLQIQMRLLQLLADEPEQAVQAIPGLPAEEQEFWIQLLLSIANELDPPAGQSDEERLQRTTTLLCEAERQLRRAAPLTLRNAVFCHRINSFGSYERFPQSEFVPGQPVLLYVEVQNFHSELVNSTGYRSRLRTMLQIYAVGPDGTAPPTALPVDRREFPATEDFCRSIRTDYFHSYRLDLPTTLATGRYVLRIAMVDELSGKQATIDAPFAVR